MSPVSRPRPRRSFVLALLVTTAASALLGACNVSDHQLFPGKSTSLATPLADPQDPDAAGAVAQWAAAYAKKPEDPHMALGYAQALKTIGSKDQALEVLKVTYQRDQSNGEIAAELGRLALDMGHLEIAKATLQTAEAKGVHDWKTLSAQGTLHAKQGDHAGAQQYFLAALQVQPDAVSVINNLALSYALDGKADKAETLLRKTVDGGKADKRVRQNLALVLGLEGKFEEARQVASVDMPEADAKTNMAYLRNMLSAPGKVASLDGDEVDAEPLNRQASADEWQPYASKAETTRNAAMEPSAARSQAASTAQMSPAAQAAVAAPSATPARVAALLPSEGGSSTVAKSPAQPAKALAAKPVAPAPATLLRATVD